MPKISVVLPAYNAEKYIGEAIDSILNQTYEDFELIVLNDCSKDRTEEIILSYDDPRIVYLKNEQNMGVAATLNRGLDAAKGEYIARMDADDISLPERFEKQVAYLDSHPKCGICGSAMQIFGEGITPYIAHYAVHKHLIQAEHLFNSAFAHPTVMIRRSALVKAGGYYDASFEKAEDYELWNRLLKHCEGYNFPEYLLRYRHHNSQVTVKCKDEQQRSLRRLRDAMLADMQVKLSDHEREVLYRLCNGEWNIPQEDYNVFISGGRKIISVAKGYSLALRWAYAKFNVAINLASNIKKRASFLLIEHIYFLYRAIWRVK